MRLYPAIAAALLSCVSALGAQSTALTDADVDASIAAAKQPEFKSMFVEAHGRFGAFFSVILQGPAGRTMDLARETFDNYKPMTAAMVPAAARARAVTFAVLPHGGPEIKNVVVMPPGATSRDAAIQPLPSEHALAGKDVQPRTWRPKFGWEPTGAASFYRFAEADLPPGDLLIIIVTNRIDERYTVKAQERDRIR